MTFEEWLAANQFEDGQLNSAQLAALRAMWARRHGTADPSAEGHQANQPARKPKGTGKQQALALATQQLATADNCLRLVSAAADVQIIAAENAEEETPTFTMLAYTGGLMDVGWMYGVVVDLAGLRISSRPRPVFLEHDRQAIVGHTTKTNRGSGRLAVAGIMSGDEDLVGGIVKKSDRGFPWRASISVRVEKMLFVEAGKKAKANGREFEGPVYILRKGTLGEVSFVALAADDDTSATVAASSGPFEVSDMDFEAWMKAQGFDPEALSDAQKTSLKALYESESATPANANSATTATAPPVAAAANGPTATPTAAAEKTPEQLATEAVTGERDRVKLIEAACKGLEDDRVAELRVKALAGDISLEELRSSLLDHLRNQRTTPTQTPETRDGRRMVLLAAAYLAGQLPEKQIIADCGEPAIEAASKFRGLGIQEFCAMVCAVDGIELPRYQSGPSAWLSAAFSSMSLPGVLSNVANKSLLAGYEYVESTWRDVVKIASVKDFKLHSRYRLTGDMKFEKVGPDGELKHGALDEQTFTQQADTWGIMFALTRQAIINDDLGAFLALPRMFGMGAAEAIAEAVWTLLLSNPSSFFHADNSNYAEGSGTALGIDALTAAEQLFLDQTKPNGRPLGIAPKRLLVPTALKVTAEQLMASLEMRDTTASRKSLTKNPHAGKFTTHCSAYLSNATITGYSALAWYLFADPAVLAALEVAFLNGIDRPTVEKAEADFNTLGIQLRGYSDWGVKEQDPRAAVKMKGEA